MPLHQINFVGIKYDRSAIVMMSQFKLWWEEDDGVAVLLFFTPITTLSVAILTIIKHYTDGAIYVHNYYTTEVLRDLHCLTLP